MRLILGPAVLALTLLATPGLTEEPSAKAWAYAAEPAFELGTQGRAFFIIGENEGCFEDEGMWGCSVFAEGRRYVSYEGSLTPTNILDILAILPIGALIELNGDIYAESPDRYDVVFSQALPFQG